MHYFLTNIILYTNKINYELMVCDHSTRAIYDRSSEAVSEINDKNLSESVTLLVCAGASWVYGH